THSEPATTQTPMAAAAGARINATTNSLSTKLCIEASSGGRLRCALWLVAEAAAVDAIAKSRALDLQQLRRLRLVAVADFERPENQVGLELAQAVVERDRCGGLRWRRRGNRRIRRVFGGAEHDRRRHAAD